MFFAPNDAMQFDRYHQQQISGLVGPPVYGKDFTVQHAEKALDFIAGQAVKRVFPWWKAMRPHEMIPFIREFKVPDGDYSVGLEIETYVANDDDMKLRQQIVDYLKPLPYVCLDSDGAGGRAGAKVMLEATFPPVLASQIAEWDALGYVQFLADNKLVIPTTPETQNVGIHINMAKGGAPRGSHKGFHSYVCNNVAKNKKYFGRSMGVSISGQGNGITEWMELRMFNTTLDPKQLLWYVEASKLIVDMVIGGADARTDFYTPLEAAYNKFYNV